MLMHTHGSHGQKLSILSIMLHFIFLSQGLSLILELDCLSARSGNPDSAHHGAGVTVAARFLYKHGEGYILLLAWQELPSSLLPSHFSSFNSCDFHIVWCCWILHLLPKPQNLLLVLFDVFCPKVYCLQCLLCWIFRHKLVSWVWLHFSVYIFTISLSLSCHSWQKMVTKKCEDEDVSWS